MRKAATQGIKKKSTFARGRQGGRGISPIGVYDVHTYVCLQTYVVQPGLAKRHTSGVEPVSRFKGAWRLSPAHLLHTQSWQHQRASFLTFAWLSNSFAHSSPFSPSGVVSATRKWPPCPTAIKYCTHAGKKWPTNKKTRARFLKRHRDSSDLLFDNDEFEVLGVHFIHSLCRPKVQSKRSTKQEILLPRSQQRRSVQFLFTHAQLM